MASNELDVFPPSRAALSTNNRKMLGSKRCRSWARW
jgi:hypothetical protein